MVQELVQEEDESIKSLDLETLIFCEIGQDAHDAVYAAERLLFSLMNISEEDWLEEARNFTDIETLSWVQTASFKYQLDELANIIDDYNKCPLKCRELEYEILRLFAYIYANTACFDFFTTQPAFAFNWDSALTMLQLEREDFVIARARVHDKKKYLKKKEFLILKLLEILIYPFLIFSLFWWHFDFSSWNTPELYLSLLAAALLGDLGEKQKQKARRKRSKTEKNLKKTILSHFKKANKLLIFSNPNGEILIDDLLHKSITVFKFSSYHLSMPNSVIFLLKEKKRRGELLVENRK